MEELDQVQTAIEDGEDLFDGVEAVEEEVETEVENEVKDETEVETPKEEVKPFSLHVKFNDEEKDLNENDARTYAQKGMNYDKIYEPLQRLAKLNGLQVGEYLNKLSEFEVEKNANEELEKLKEIYPDSSEEVLNELAHKRAMENQNLQFKKIEDEQKGNDDALKAEAQRQIDVFKKEYPDIDNKTLHEDVYNLVRQGYTLLEAYNKWAKLEEEKQRPALEAKEKVAKLNEDNKKKSLGNITNAGNDEPDDFFVGLNSI